MPDPFKGGGGGISPVVVSPTKHTTLADSTTAAISPAGGGAVTEATVGCYIQGVDKRTGAAFSRAFANLNAMQQWLATDPNAANYDFSSGVLGPVKGF
jgi:hypothetical protein